MEQKSDTKINLKSYLWTTWAFLWLIGFVIDLVNAFQNRKDQGQLVHYLRMSRKARPKMQTFANNFPSFFKDDLKQKLHSTFLILTYPSETASWKTKKQTKNVWWYLLWSIGNGIVVIWYRVITCQLNQRFLAKMFDFANIYSEERYICIMMKTKILNIMEEYLLTE